MYTDVKVALTKCPCVGPNHLCILGLSCLFNKSLIPWHIEVLIVSTRLWDLSQCIYLIIKHSRNLSVDAKSWTTLVIYTSCRVRYKLLTVKGIFGPGLIGWLTAEKQACEEQDTQIGKAILSWECRHKWPGLQ